MSMEALSEPAIVSGSGGKKDYSKIALIAAIAGLAVSVFGLYTGLDQENVRPFLGWLIAFSFWLSVGLGMLFLIMLFYLFDSGWSVVLRRPLEHALGGFKWLGLIFLPLLLVSVFLSGNGAILWKWMDPAYVLIGGGTVAEDPLYQAKAAYLNVPFFVLRSVIYFGIWIGLAAVLRHSSFSMDKDGDTRWTSRCRKWSAFGVIACAMTVTFASIDWFMSIEYQWFSTMYGVWFFSESMRSGLAVLVIICWFLSTRGALQGLFKPSHNYLLGCLMLAFTVFWAYISFCQYFLIYSANIPEETFWYNIRELSGAPGGDVKSSWWWVSMGLIFGHFLFPFFFLLWYKNKFGLRIVFISVWILVFHLLDIYWNILPGRYPAENPLGYGIRQFNISIWDISGLIGIGGLLVWAFLNDAKKTAPIPLRDPRIMESLTHHE